MSYLKNAKYFFAFSLIIASLTILGNPSIAAVQIFCPSGYMKAGPNLCIQKQARGDKGKFYHYTDKRETKNKIYVEAQTACRRQGAHVCTYSEYYQAWDKLEGDISKKDMIGNFILDDKILCVNNPNSKTNFEGYCHKHYKYRYRCCLSKSNPLI